MMTEMTERQAYSWLVQPGIQATLYGYDKDTNEALKVAIESLGAKVKESHPLYQLEREALDVEANHLEFVDGEIEIGLTDEMEIVICEYSKSQQAAMQRKVFGFESMFDGYDGIRKLCDKHGWAYTI